MTLPLFGNRRTPTKKRRPGRTVRFDIPTVPGGMSRVLSNWFGSGSTLPVGACAHAAVFGLGALGSLPTASGRRASLRALRFRGRPRADGARLHPEIQIDVRAKVHLAPRPAQPA